MNFMKHKRVPLSGAMVACCAVFAPLGCSGGEAQDCQKLYEASPAHWCLSLEEFEFYACSSGGENDPTDDTCFLTCTGLLEEDEALCYQVERCQENCSWDTDMSGCEVAYYGGPNTDCISYENYFIAACDPRNDVGVRACVQDCYEQAANCAEFNSCQGACS